MQRIEKFNMNLFHKIGTSISCMLLFKIIFASELLHNKHIDLSQIDPLTCIQNGCFKKEPRFRDME